MEEKAPNEMEVAAKAHEERKKIEKTAQGRIRIFLLKNF